MCKLFWQIKISPHPFSECDFFLTLEKNCWKKFKKTQAKSKFSKKIVAIMKCMEAHTFLGSQVLVRTSTHIEIISNVCFWHKLLTSAKNYAMLCFVANTVQKKRGGICTKKAERPYVFFYNT